MESTVKPPLKTLSQLMGLRVFFGAGGALVNYKTLFGSLRPTHSSPTCTVVVTLAVNAVCAHSQYYNYGTN